MSVFDKTTLTQKGLALLGKSGLGLVFTRVETGCGVFAASEDISRCAALRDKRQDVDIASASKVSDCMASVKFTVTNEALTEQYLFTEIGLFAKDPDEGEILYALCVCTPENASVFPAFNGKFIHSLKATLKIEVASGQSVEVVSGKPDVYVDMEEFEEHQNSKSAHGIGALDDLTTSVRTSVVGAINEISRLLTECARGRGLDFCVNDGILCVMYEDDLEEGEE